MKLYKNSISLRGDHYYCPLSFQLSTYWNCEANCAHCYLRRLNRTWGTDLRPADIDHLKKLVDNILRREPVKPLDYAIHKRKTIYCGAKSDCYQHAEIKYRATREALKFLLSRGFSVVIATMFTENLERDIDLFEKYKNNVIIMPIVSPGLEKDWDILERKFTTHPMKRLEDACKWRDRGFQVGINGEPFIPNFHNIDDFSRTISIIKDMGLKSYNTYYLHLNDYNAKSLHATAKVDIEKVWEANQDSGWKPILKELIKIAGKENIILGCPDFVNSGDYMESTNTCCGINAPSPTTFNLITWKKLRAAGLKDETIIEQTWDGIGDKEYGLKLLKGEISGMYSLNDIENKKDERSLF